MSKIKCAPRACPKPTSCVRRLTLIGIDQSAIPVSALGSILIAAPHPDDETLGCGGLVAHCSSAGNAITVLAMTSGGASHPGDDAWRDELCAIRECEQREALRVLGLVKPDIVRLGLSDGKVDRLKGEIRKRVVKKIQNIIRARRIGSLFVPAIDDCHSDHQETAKLFAEAVRGLELEYFFNYQIWPPEIRPSQVRNNEIGFTLDISDVLTLKRRAIQKHYSQLRTLDPTHANGFRMPPALLQSKLKKHESYALVGDVSAWSS